MHMLRQRNEAVRATLQRLKPLSAQAASQGRHSLVFQRLFWGALAGCLMAFFFGESPILENLELSMLEWRYKIADQLTNIGVRAPVQMPASKDIRIVAFDDASQFDLGFPRFNESNAQAVLAQVLENIEKGDPTVVAIDLDLRGAANPELIRVFRRYRNVVLAVFGSLEGSSDLPDAEFLQHAAGYGYDELTHESNGMVLRLPVNSPNQMATDNSGMAQVPSFTEAIMAAYREKRGLNPSSQLQSVTPDQPVYINFKRMKFPCYSMTDVLRSDFRFQKFKNNVVLVAPTLTSRRQDPSHVVTPLRGRSAEVYVHADAVHTFLRDEMIWSCPRGIAHHILILLGALFGALCSILPMGKRALCLLGGGALLLLIAQATFQVWNMAIPVVAPLAMLGSGYIIGTVIFLDTDLRVRNKELATARESMQVRAEEERKRIAEDLHDETLPALSSVARMIDELYKVNDFERSTVPEKMRLKIDATIAEMRRVINDLHPSVLETMGFVPALENLTSILARDAGLEYTFQDRNTDDSYEISDFRKLQLYRIVQEALNNVGKHAQATKVAVRLQKLGNSLEISIADNGLGINPKALRRDSHGLLNIRHRAQLIRAIAEWRKPEAFETGTEFRVKVMLSDDLPPHVVSHPGSSTMNQTDAAIDQKKGTENA
jgi:signal transduction histidine kinase